MTTRTAPRHTVKATHPRHPSGHQPASRGMHTNRPHRPNERNFTPRPQSTTDTKDQMQVSAPHWSAHTVTVKWGLGDFASVSRVVEVQHHFRAVKEQLAATSDADREERYRLKDRAFMLQHTVGKLENMQRDANGSPVVTPKDWSPDSCDVPEKRPDGCTFVYTKDALGDAIPICFPPGVQTSLARLAEPSGESKTAPRFDAEFPSPWTKERTTEVVRFMRVLGLLPSGVNMDFNMDSRVTIATPEGRRSLAELNIAATATAPRSRLPPWLQKRPALAEALDRRATLVLGDIPNAPEGSLSVAVTDAAWRDFPLAAAALQGGTALERAVEAAINERRDVLDALRFVLHRARANPSLTNEALTAMFVRVLSASRIGREPPALQAAARPAGATDHAHELPAHGAAAAMPAGETADDLELGEIRDEASNLSESPCRRQPSAAAAARSNAGCNKRSADAPPLNDTRADKRARRASPQTDALRADSAAGEGSRFDERPTAEASDTRLRDSASRIAGDGVCDMQTDPPQRDAERPAAGALPARPKVAVQEGELVVPAAEVAELKPDPTLATHNSARIVDHFAPLTEVTEPFSFRGFEAREGDAGLLPIFGRPSTSSAAANSPLVSAPPQASAAADAEGLASAALQADEVHDASMADEAGEMDAAAEVGTASMRALDEAFGFAPAEAARPSRVLEGSSAADAEVLVSAELQTDEDVLMTEDAELDEAAEVNTACAGMRDEASIVAAADVAGPTRVLEGSSDAEDDARAAAINDDDSDEEDSDADDADDSAGGQGGRAQPLVGAAEAVAPQGGAPLDGGPADAAAVSDLEKKKEKKWAKMERQARAANVQLKRDDWLLGAVQRPGSAIIDFYFTKIASKERFRSEKQVWRHLGVTVTPAAVPPAAAAARGSPKPDTPPRSPGARKGRASGSAAQAPRPPLMDLPNGVSEEIPVDCNGLKGTFLARTQHVRLPDGTTCRAVEFMIKGGRESYKCWRRAIDVDDGGEKRTIGKLLIDAALDKNRLVEFYNNYYDNQGLPRPSRRRRVAPQQPAADAANAADAPPASGTAPHGAAAGTPATGLEGSNGAASAAEHAPVDAPPPLSAPAEALPAQMAQGSNDSDPPGADGAQPPAAPASEPQGAVSAAQHARVDTPPPVSAPAEALPAPLAQGSGGSDSGPGDEDAQPADALLLEPQDAGAQPGSAPEAVAPVDEDGAAGPSIAAQPHAEAAEEEERKTFDEDPKTGVITIND